MRVPLDEFMADRLAEDVQKKKYLPTLALLATVLFGLLGVAIGLYSLLHEKKPEISFEIISEANVFDVRKPLQDLTISFQNEDIQQKNLNLRILTVRIENKGEMDILQSHFDQNIAWGFQVTEGEIIDEVRLIDSNSEYLQSNLGPRIANRNSVELG